MSVKKSEMVSLYTHLFALAASVVSGAVLLCSAGKTPTLFITTALYCLSTVFLFSASSLYHYNKRRENEENIWRKLDHFAIFIMIAGTYTPMVYMFLDGAMRSGIIMAQWSLVLLGLFFKFFFINAPRFLSTFIYLAMGWIVLIPLKQLLEVMPGTVILYTSLGAAAFTLGGIIYAVKKPNLKPGFMGFHEIFHLFIVVGWIFHYFMVYESIRVWQP